MLVLCGLQDSLSPLDFDYFTGVVCEAAGEWATAKDLAPTSVRAFLIFPAMWLVCGGDYASKVNDAPRQSQPLAPHNFTVNLRVLGLSLA